MDCVDLETRLKEFDQEHLMRFYNTLDDDQQIKLTNELKGVDYKLITKLYGRAKVDLEKTDVKKDDLMELISPELRVEKSTAPKETVQEWENRGLQEMGDNTVGVILLAGGQGTRLGFNHPKGMYNVGLPSNKTLYQLQAERIFKLQKLAEAKTGNKSVIRWYIMTSESTLKDTKDYFESNSFFGLEPSAVVFFEQHQLPCLTFEGKLILKTPGSLAKAPDGNGGLYTALRSAKVVDDMEQNGVKHVFVYCVDNILVKIADPSFIGYCAMKDLDASNKVIEKKEPNESVGVMCKCEGKFQVVEYSEISQTTAEKRSEDGRLLFNDSNICMHYFNTRFLRQIITEHLEEMPHHIAKKKIPYVDDKGVEIKPTKPNGMKLEKFVFDVFQYTSNFGIFVCERDEEFSPLKNGPDTPKCSAISCRQDISNLCKKYLRNAGAEFVDDDGKTVENCTNLCEISPLLSFDGEGLESFKGQQFSSTQHIHLQPDDSTNSPRSKKSKN